MGKANEGMYIYRRSCRSLSLMMLSCLTVSFSCVVCSRGNRTPESEKKQTSAYLIKRKMKKKFCMRTSTTYLIGLQKICFQKIKNQNWALIGRSVTSTMVIFIFRKICFQPRNPGGLFFLFSGCLFYSKFMRCAPPSVPHIQSALVPPSLPRHTREHTGTHLSLIHIWRCRRYSLCRSRWAPYH